MILRWLSLFSAARLSFLHSVSISSSTLVFKAVPLCFLWNTSDASAKLALQISPQSVPLPGSLQKVLLVIMAIIFFFFPSYFILTYCLLSSMHCTNSEECFHCALSEGWCCGVLLHEQNPEVLWQRAVKGAVKARSSWSHGCIPAEWAWHTVLTVNIFGKNADMETVSMSRCAHRELPKQSSVHCNMCCFHAYREMQVLTLEKVKHWINSGISSYGSGVLNQLSHSLQHLFIVISLQRY